MNGGGHAGYFIRERTHQDGKGYYVLCDSRRYTSGAYVMHTALPITTTTLSKWARLLRRLSPRVTALLCQPAYASHICATT